MIVTRAAGMTMIVSRATGTGTLCATSIIADSRATHVISTPRASRMIVIALGTTGTARIKAMPAILASRAMHAVFTLLTGETMRICL